jgi:pro-sigmaK processing inhibitor BofA
MFKFLLKILKKVVIGMVLLFGYNTFLSSLNLMIPINVITVIVASFFDVPGIIGLALFLLFNY